MTAAEAREQLSQLASPELAKSAGRFFKTGPGQYGEGDVFIGVRVPALRKLARAFGDLPMGEIENLLHSPVHEERLFALLVLVSGVIKWCIRQISIHYLALHFWQESPHATTCLEATTSPGDDG
ncbi:DNA alkylation repair protein [Zavarzinella formosa]|uniref:DNA alkylation repair protein n=1 Tax=Zavarzinella formosa TaxID=360055 RepID=UPI0002FDC94E